MNQQEISQYQVSKNNSIEQIEVLKTYLSNLSNEIKTHNHDSLSSIKIDFKNIMFSVLSQSMSFVSLADDATLEIPENYGIGLVMAGTVDQCALFKFSTDGSVELLANTTNVINADVDGNLCIYDAGTKVKIKNRLGSTKEIRYIIFS